MLGCRLTSAQSRRLSAAVAAGHPATVDAGIEVLAAGGSAADAAVAACLASCVAETVMTGLLGGGHAIYFDAPQRARAQPRLLLRRARAEPAARCSSWTCLSARSSSTTRSGPASCAVPGLPAGLDALWRDHGRLPWRDLCAACASSGSTRRADAAGARCLPGDARAGDDDARGRADLRTTRAGCSSPASILDQPGLVTALELLADEGARERVHAARSPSGCSRPWRSAEGVVTRADLEGLRGRLDAIRSRSSTRARGFLTRGGLSGVAPALSRLPPLRGLGEPARTLALLDALDEAPARRRTRRTSSPSTPRAAPAC